MFYLVVSEVRPGLTFFNTALIQLHFIPEVIAQSVYTPSLVLVETYHNTLVRRMVSHANLSNMFN